ncbi:helix-turn-helix transcriptional regulator [Paenibacillus sambharensis]|uniref:Helix-turn-helix transcriptional regulator n=1 Tax=Paenibacillus sambharensis TaxID=1803190 RepID=A0A2W1LQC7_9BACL|nr:LuxR C-terminal-related transcriptional regulator [Paenibacillus sambharensis]PZD97142.1 helix-turn-helix transcriptional regulator [Paenibacillus sambharensis]
MGANPRIMKYKLEIPAAQKHWVNRALLHIPPEGTPPQGITLITAPAGSGKSTVMTQLVHQYNQQTAWYTLDENDNDLRRFWRHIVYMLQPCLAADACGRLLALLAEYADRSLEPFLDQFLNELFDTSGPVSVALDDYHVITRQEIHASLNYWLNHLPSKVHVMIASRSEPPLANLQAWNVKGKLQRIGSLQLAFTVDQAEELCHSILGQSLSSDCVSSLVARTEGWAAGLQLALITLKQRPSKQWSYWLHDQDMGNYIKEYLLKVVWSGLDEPTRRFLLETSVLTRFDARLCEEVTGLPECDDKLASLQDNGLFLISVGGGLYRYHQLAGDFYEALLRQQSPERWSELKRNACLAYAREGWYEEAVDYAFTAEAYDLASGLLDEHLHGLVMKGEFSLLETWFNRFPEAFPIPARLRLVSAFVSTVQGKHEEAGRVMKHLEEELQASPSHSEQLDRMSGLFFVKVNHAFHSGQFQEWFRFSESIHARLPQDPVFFDFNYNYNQPFVRYTSFGLHGALTDTTAEMGWKITSLLSRNGWEDSLMCQYVLQSLAEGYYEWNELDRCRELLDRITVGKRYLEVPGLLVPVRLTMARLCLIEGDRTGARAIIDQTLRRLDQPSHSPWRRSLLIFLADIDLAEGAVDHAEARLLSVNSSRSHRVHLGAVQETLTLARLLIARGETEEGYTLLMRLSLLVEESGMVNLAVSVMILQAFADIKQGRCKEASRRIKKAVLRVMPFHYVRTFIDEGEWMRSILEEMLAVSAFDQPEMKAYAAALLTTMTEEIADQKSDHPSDTNGFGLTVQETEVVRLLHLGYTNREISEQMRLTLGTVKVYLNRIYSKLGVRTRTQAVLVTTPAAADYLSISE